MVESPVSIAGHYLIEPFTDHHCIIMYTDLFHCYPVFAFIHYEEGTSISDGTDDGIKEMVPLRCNGCTIFLKLPPYD